MISLKWKIQAWYALILALVLSVLGVGFYFNERAHRLAELDSTLDQQIHPLVRASEVKQGRLPPPKKEFDPGNMYSSDLAKPGGGWEIDRNEFSPRSQSGSGMDKRGAFVNVESRFEDLGFYCIAWNTKSGDLVYRSQHAPEMEAPMDIDDGYMKRIRDGRYREIFLVNPSVRIIVAFDMQQIHAELGLLKWQITGVMFAIYAVSLLVGGWLVAGSLSPLKVIQRTTASIAKGTLSERIPEKTGGHVTELVHLTDDLNDTFTKLDDLFQRQVRFTADASHELRNPLSVLIGRIESGRQYPHSVEEYQEILEICGRSARRIKRITDDLMELFRYDSGRFELELEMLPLDQLIASLAEDLEPIVAEHGSTLRTDLQSVALSCDPFRLEQVINNLVNNALQHNSSPITIMLRVVPEANGACIEVIDNGKGIQPQNLDKLFDRFYQESESRTKSSRKLNVGLGLSISQAIIKAHGGTIQVRSRPGIETVFTIHLPPDGTHSTTSTSSGSKAYS